MGEHEASGPLWAGRLEGGLHPDVLALSQSLDIDQRLLPYDIAASKAHARMLGHQGIIPADDAAAIVKALDSVAIDAGATDEDVHSLIERQLVAELGDVGRRVHAGRSRNDQVATAFRLWCRAHAFALIQGTADLQAILVERAHVDGAAVLPAFTHLQRAQPVPLAHHLAAHVWSLQRDVGRFQAALDAADVSPLGAGALAARLAEKAEAMRAAVERRAAAEATLAAKRAAAEVDPPNEYLCGIGFHLMRDPVIVETGQTYEREAIAQWLETHETCPLTGVVLAHKFLTPNVSLRKLIDGYVNDQVVPEERAAKRPRFDMTDDTFDLEL